MGCLPCAINYNPASFTDFGAVGTVPAVNCGMPCARASGHFYLRSIGGIADVSFSVVVIMKNVIKAAALSSLMISGSAFALGMTLEKGKSWTNVEAEMGRNSSGLYVHGNWLKNTDDGEQTGGVGAGYNLGVGPVMLNVGAKALYIGPKKGATGLVVPVGGGLRVNLDNRYALYGEGYTAPNGFGNSVSSYTEANAGVSWAPISILTLKAGYRYAGVEGKKGRPDHTIYDGLYVSAAASF